MSELERIQAKHELRAKKRREIDKELAEFHSVTSLAIPMDLVAEDELTAPAPLPILARIDWKLKHVGDRGEEPVEIILGQESWTDLEFWWYEQSHKSSWVTSRFERRSQTGMPVAYMGVPLRHAPDMKNPRGVYVAS